MYLETSSFHLKTKITRIERKVDLKRPTSHILKHSFLQIGKWRRHQRRLDTSEVAIQHSPWVWIFEFSREPAAPSRGTWLSCTRKRQKGAHLFNFSNGKKTSLHFSIYNPFQNTSEGIASHSHEEMTAEFITGSFQGSTSEAETYLHYFPAERRVTDFQIS